MVDRIGRVLEAGVLAGAILTIPLILLGEENPTPSWVGPADWVVWSVFVLEYSVMLIRSADRAGYVKRHPLDLGVIILSYPHLPLLFSLVRLARLTRILRLLRLVGVTARAVGAMRTIIWRRGVVSVVCISSLIMVAGGAGLTLLEPQTVHGGFLDGIWWAVVTASTVGYGDIAPSTLPGRLIAVLLMLCGVGLISTLAASITAYFVGQEKNNAIAEISERTLHIEKLLHALLVQSATSAEAAPVKHDASRTPGED
jgi:voltage-gated potassium channel